MKTIHPDIAGRRFICPPDSDDCLDHFLASLKVPREELLSEVCEGISTEHSRATPTTSPGEEPAYLLELARFIVVYQLLPGTVEVFTILCKRDPDQLENPCYFTAAATNPSEPQAYTHPDIADKEITCLNLDDSFADFAYNACGSSNTNFLIDDLKHTIRFRHGEAKQVPFSSHPRALWELQSSALRFHYQVLDRSVEVGSLWSSTTGTCYEPSQDRLAEYTT